MDRGRLRVHPLIFKATVSSKSKPNSGPFNLEAHLCDPSCGNISHSKPSSQTTSYWVQILGSMGTFQIQAISQVHIQGSLSYLK